MATEKKPSQQQQQEKQTSSAALTKPPESHAERFANKVLSQFSSFVGQDVVFGEHERKLAQHLFIKVDAALKEFESKRTDEKKAPFTWANVDMEGLAISAVARVGAGLDALIPNHIHAVPYWSGAKGKYTIDLRVGYAGKVYYTIENAMDNVTAIVCELVYSTDKFAPVKRSLSNPVESYEFEITQPFDRGNLVGGFGYIMHDDPAKNKLIIVTKKDIDKAKSVAKSGDFWTKWPDEMALKTVVHRTAKHVTIDPRKGRTSAIAAIEAEEEAAIEDAAFTVIEQNANTKELPQAQDAQPAEPEPEKEKEAQAQSGNAASDDDDYPEALR